MSDDTSFQLTNAYITPVDELGLPLPGVAPQPVGELTVTMKDIGEVLAHTEVVETPDVDLVVSPGQVWLVPKHEQQTLSWEVEISEESFWLIVGVVYGAEVVREMKQDLEDLLRWEEEGGPCVK